jgi:hypothetical protein
MSRHKPVCINAEAVGEVIAKATNDEKDKYGLNYSGRDDAQARGYALRYVA